MTTPTAHPATATRRTRTSLLRRIRSDHRWLTVSDHRRLAVAGAVLAVGLLFGGCDSDSPVAAGSTAPSVSLPEPSEGDVAGVADISTAWDAAWNAGDAVALAGLFVADAEFINGRGQIAVGAAAIRAQHAVSLAGIFKGSHTEGRIRRITFLSATSAVLDVDNELTGFVSMPPGVTPTEPGVNRGRHKRLVVKIGGTWHIQLMQITSVAPTL